MVLLVFGRQGSGTSLVRSHRGFLQRQKSINSRARRWLHRRIEIISDRCRRDLRRINNIRNLRLPLQPFCLACLARARLLWYSNIAMIFLASRKLMCEQLFSKPSSLPRKSTPSIAVPLWNGKHGHKSRVRLEWLEPRWLESMWLRQQEIPKMFPEGIRDWERICKV